MIVFLVFLSCNKMNQHFFKGLPAGEIVQTSASTETPEPPTPYWSDWTYSDCLTDVSPHYQNRFVENF